MDNSLKTIKYFWSNLKRFKKEFWASIFIAPIIFVVGGYIPPLILAGVLNKLSTHNYLPHHLWTSFRSEIILYAILQLSVTMVFWRVFDIFYWKLEGKMERAIYQDVFSHLLNQSANFHANEFSGSLVSRTNKIANSYIRIADTTLFSVIPLVVGVIAVAFIMMGRSSIYSIVLVVFSVIYVAGSIVIGKRVRKLNALEAASESKQTGFIADALTNIMAIKSFAKEKIEKSRFAEVTNETYSRLMDVAHAFQIQQTVYGGITGILSVVSLLVAILAVVNYGANVATAFLIFNYTTNIIGLLYNFSNSALRNYNRAFGDASEMTETLQLAPEVVDPKKPEELKIKQGEIEFRNVNFGHQGSSEDIFKNFNLKIKPGEKIGLVGHSGAGKSTLVRLLMRFSDIDSGQILIDGQNIAKVKQEDLRKVISYVPQEPLLFHRSIKENIAYNNPDVSKKALIDASIKAHTEEFISALPDGYNTLVGERGIKLSGGQRQRIAIARAILKKTPVLILDEATSSLDSESERLIQDSLKDLMEGRTTIIIAHRLSTIQIMDRILVLEDGKIVEDGKHQDLLKRPNGIYAKLWQHQSGGFLED